MKNKLTRSDSIDTSNKLAHLLIILIPFHAFLTVVGSSLVGHYTLLRLWDEIVLIAILAAVCVVLYSDQKLRKTLTGSWLVRIIGLYCLLTIAWGGVALALGGVEPKALGFAFIVNLRFLLWFLALLIVRIKVEGWEKLILIPLAIVVAFALLQFFVLPHKFLAQFGYDSLVNVAPEITINKSTNIIRAQSFLRGPNPLGAYLVMMLGLLLAVVSMKKKWHILLISMLLLALGVTFSRSAWVAAIIVATIVLWVRLSTRKLRLALGAGILTILVIAAGIFYTFQHHQDIQAAFLHVHDESSQIETSNEGHASAFQDGLSDVMSEPLGRGPGSAGPASLYNTGHEQRNSESYYLQIAQETGWIGLALFVAINIMIALALWKQRRTPIALGLFAGLIGLTFINQLSYAWSDDTLAYIWWGMAAMALAPSLMNRETQVGQQNLE